MSAFNEIDIECENCGEEYRGTVWAAIHAGEDPELKDLLMGGELNLVSCPACAHVFFQERFLIYQEPDAELVVYVYPPLQLNEEAELRTNMLKGFREAQETLPKKDWLHYDPILLFGLESLIEMLETEQLRGFQSQVAQAVCIENRISTFLLSPSRARELQTVRAIPYAGDKKSPTREDILSGIDQLLAIDPVLDDYAKLKAAIQSDKAWTL